MSTTGPLVNLLDNDLPPSYGAAVTVRPFKAAEFVKDGKTHILLAASGSLATDILSKVIDELQDEPQISIRVVLAAAASNYLSSESLLQKPNVEAVYTDQDWPEHERDKPNAFLNYELRTWLDFMLVAPCSANTISSIVAGKSEDLVTSILQIFDAHGKMNPAGRIGRFKYLAIAPALDSVTWQHPSIKENIDILRNRWTYTQKFNSGLKRSVSWAVTILRLADENTGSFNHLEDNCNMQVELVMEEVRWELSKFQKTHDMYAPGV